ncbi:MAG: GNAT family N-acetyltransferase [Actinomycetota bacterium]
MFEFRAPTIDDVDWITRACQDPDILRFTEVPRPYTAEHARAFVADLAGELKVWTIRDVDTNEGLGVVGVHHVRERVASIGYWVAPWGRRRGAAVDAVLHACKELATWDDVDVVAATIASTNLASQSVARRAGFGQSCRPLDTQCPDGDARVDAIIFERRLRP